MFQAALAENLLIVRSADTQFVKVERMVGGKQANQNRQSVGPRKAQTECFMKEMKIEPVTIAEQLTWLASLTIQSATKASLHVLVVEALW